MTTQLQSIRDGRSGRAMVTRLAILCAAVTLCFALLPTQASAASYIRIDTQYPPIGPRWIPDITRPGDSVGLAADEIIDILILGDGYLAAESTRFVSHAQLWYDRTFGNATPGSIRPYTYFPQAFRVRAGWVPSDDRASTARGSHYRVKIDADDKVSGDGWWDGDSEPNRGFRDSLFSVVESLPNPKDTTRYPSSLNNSVYGHLIVHSPMANVYSHLYVVMLIRAKNDTLDDFNPSGRCRTVIKYGEPQRVRVAFGKYEQHEFGHAFGYLDDEYISSRGTVNTEYRNPAPEDRSVFNLVNINFLPVNIDYDDPDDRCDDMLIWPHLAPGGEHNPSISSLIGNLFTGMDKFATGAAHSEYKCLLNGTHENYFCDFSGPDTNIRDYNNMCFWCEEITALRILERTHQLDRPGDSADINARGRQWFRLWDDSLRHAYYEYFNVDSMIVAKDSCYDLSCPACSTYCGATTKYPLPTCIAECQIRDLGHAVFVDGDNGDNLNVGSNVSPKRTILNAVGAACDPHYLIMLKTASYPGAITITQRAILARAGCSSVVVGK